MSKIVLEQTYSNVSILLESPKIATSSSERSLLKNIGSWLGQITLAKVCVLCVLFMRWWMWCVV